MDGSLAVASPIGVLSLRKEDGMTGKDRGDEEREREKRKRC